MITISSIAPWVIAVVSLVLMMYFAMGLLRDKRADQRLNALSKHGSSSVLRQSNPPQASATRRSYGSYLSSRASQSSQSLSRRTASGSIVSEYLKKEDRRKAIREKMQQAGLYSNQAGNVLVLVRCASFVLPLVIGYVAGRMGLLTPLMGLAIGLLLGLLGIVAPSFWLDYMKATRQKQIRKSLPDALDLISVCVEGGLSLSASISRVASELATAHPVLGLELAIVERQTRMGRSTGQAMREFADRFDLEELRSLASVIVHAERYGTSVTKALAVYAETLRIKRHQRAEENAQKAVIKMLFPTLFLIFPGIFIVVLGPAMIQIYNVLLERLLQAPPIPI